MLRRLEPHAPPRLHLTLQHPPPTTSGITLVVLMRRPTVPEKQGFSAVLFPSLFYTSPNG